jgi:hypothetical protein
MDLQVVEYGVIDWMELDQDTDRWWALVNAVMNNRGNFLSKLKTVSFSRRTVLHGVSK